MNTIPLKSKWGEKQISSDPTNEYWEIVSLKAGLVKAFNLIGQESSDILLYFDGFSVVRVPSKCVSFHIMAENESHLLEECPVANIYYNKRRGDEHVNWWDITLYFKNRTQIEQYIQAVLLPPKQIERSGDSQVEGSSPSSGIIPFAIGLGLGIAIE